MRYILVGVSRSIKNESKMQQKVARGRKNGKPRSFGVFESGGGGKFWVKKTYPSLSFNLSRAGGARPGELTCFFFLAKTQVCALYGSVFAYLNPL